MKLSPIVVTFESASRYHNGNSTNANTYSRGLGVEYMDVTIGFAKETVNQVVGIHNVLDWKDFTRCEV